MLGATWVCHASTVPPVVLNHTSAARSPPSKRVSEVAPASVLNWTDEALPPASLTADARAAGALIDGLAPGSPETLVSGEPVTATRRPSLATCAITPLPKTGIPLTFWTKERWCVPSTST